MHANNKLLLWPLRSLSSQKALVRSTPEPNEDFFSLLQTRIPVNFFSHGGVYRAT